MVASVRTVFAGGPAGSAARGRTSSRRRQSVALGEPMSKYERRCPRPCRGTGTSEGSVGAQACGAKREDSPRVPGAASHDRPAGRHSSTLTNRDHWRVRMSLHLEVW